MINVSAESCDSVLVVECSVHKKELEILSGSLKSNYEDIILTIHREERKIILISEVELPKMTFNIGFISDQISKDISRSERGPSTYRRK